MKRIAVRTILSVVLLAMASACSSVAPNRDEIYQVSTLQALLDGVYDGEWTCSEIAARGDLGIGTFDGLDGEMVIYEGVVYKVPASGRAVAVPSTETTPFACATPFDADVVVRGNEPMDYDGLKKLVDEYAPNLNVPCAVRVQGMFRYVKTRSVPKQKRPYPRLVDVVKEQKIFEFHDEPGVIVGFRLPAYMKGVNVPGYHLHFLTASRTGGGHLLNFRGLGLEVAMDPSHSLRIELPEGEDFARADLASGAHEVQAVEKDPAR